jgi:hypothetical protein
MSQSIPPYRPGLPEYDQRPPRHGIDAESDGAEVSKAAAAPHRPAPEADGSTGAPRLRPEPPDASFGQALEGALDRPPEAGSAPDLTPDERQMIYRYFPEAPGLALRLYDQTTASRKVDPGAVGARVDLRG